MATNYVQEGKFVEVTAATDTEYESGAVVIIGDTLSVATGDIGKGGTGVCALEGVWELPKKAEALSSIGADVYWDGDGDPVGGDTGTGAITASAATDTGDAEAGIVFATADSASQTVQIKINA